VLSAGSKEQMADSIPHSLSDPATWVDSYGDYLYNFALSRLRDSVAAEDAVQETFLAALKAKESFAGASSEKTWFVGILKNKIIDHFRKQEREIPTDFSEEQLPFDQESQFLQSGLGKSHWDAASAPSEWGNPSELLEKKEFWAILERCLETLPDKMAKVFALRELEETPTDELTQLLKISESNLFVILHRARGQMRKCIELKWTAKRAKG
jgi:RNA polymerase sigma-70 factor (ECF subfamily)